MRLVIDVSFSNNDLVKGMTVFIMFNAEERNDCFYNV